MVENKTIIVGGYRINLTHLDKILFPDDGITKFEIIEYYTAITSTMIPYIKNHPISMHRYPNGIDHEGFYQKNAGEYFPEWITLQPVKTKEEKVVNYVVIDKKATLVYLANQLCLTPHIWLSKIDKLNYPDRMIFDLDPSGEKFDFGLIQDIAFILKDLLESIGLIPFVMTTGSRGMHVVVPLDRKQAFEEVRTFARDISLHLERLYPKYITTELRKSKRGKKIFFDYLRNAFTATAVAPYAIRAKAGAPVATPIDWNEVKDKKLVSTRYTFKTVFKRLKAKGDPWKEFNKSTCSLKKAQKKFYLL